MEAVVKLPHLKELRVWHTLNTDTGTAKLKDATNLKSVWLAPQFTTRITDQSLEHLAACKSLEEVKISETRLTWDWLKHLKSLPNVKKLNLDETDISETDLVKIKEALPKVEVTGKPPSDQQLKWINEHRAKPKN